MKKTIYYVLSLVLSVALLSLAACNKEEPPIDQTDPEEPAIVDPGEDGMIINATCSFFQEGSRATANEDGAIVWDEYDRIGVFEFTGASRNNGNIRFSIEEGVGQSTAQFRSNSELDAAWSKGDRSIYAYYPYQPGGVMAKALSISIPTEIEYDPQDPIKHLNASNIMVASADFTSSDSAEEIDLNFQSLLSPVTISLENKTDEAFELTAINVKCADGGSIFPKEASLNLINMQLITAFAETAPAFTINLKEPVFLEPDESVEVPFFLYPLNLESGNELAIELITSRKPVTVPANFLKGFSMESSSFYFEEIGVTETDFGLLGVEELPGDTNCHMIEPPSVVGTSMRYRIPLDRVNEFWNITDFDGTDFSNPENLIDANTKWVADIIWKDIDLVGVQNLITLTLHGKKGVGLDDMIEFEVSCDVDEPYGNAVIGIRKADDNFEPIGDYLWSWHIWVSDYPSNGASYDLSDGRGFITMDRNLGAKNAYPGVASSMGLMYQWGRKDPFPPVNYGYWDRDGSANGFQATTLAAPDWTARAVTGDATYGTVPYAVSQPASFILTFAGAEGGDYDWVYGTIGTAELSSTLWLDAAKTIFDPCPKGFKVASRYSFYSFTSSLEPPVEYFPSTATKRGILYDGTVWFPYNGQLSRTTGLPTSFQTGFYIQMSFPYVGTGNLMYRRGFAYNNDGLVGIDSGYGRGTALAVRCMEWPDDN